MRLAGPNIEGWTKLPTPPPRLPPPLFLSHLDANFWLHEVPDHDAIYVQVNQMRTDSLETLPEFGRRQWSVLEQRKPTNLLLDLRHNNGGVTAPYPELLCTIIAFTRAPNRRLFVIIGRNTYSATANFITDLERLASPIFVGEASSECCNFHGDAANVTLPYSGASGFVSGVRWNLSQDVFDGRRELSPDVPIPLTAATYFAGRDPALDAVFRLIDGPAKRQ